FSSRRRHTRSKRDWSSDVCSSDLLKLRVNVDEKNVATLRVGQAVKVRVSVYADKEFSGKITFIAPKSDGSLNFPVEIEIANNPRSEERRVGKECRTRETAEDEKRK